MSLKRSRLKSSLPTTARLSPLRRSDAGRPVAAALPVEDDAAPPRTPSRSSDTSERTTTTKRRLQRRVTPLEVLTEPIQAGVRKVFDLRRFLIVIAITVVVLLLPPPPGLSEQGQAGLALFAFSVSLLALEPAPLPIAALMIPICQVALGIDTVTGAFAPFGQPVLFLIMGSLFLAEALNKHGLIRRMALYTILFSKGQLWSLAFGLIVVSGLLSMWVLNTATVAVLIPVAITIAQRVQPQEKAAATLQMLLLAIAYSSSIGGMGTVMGSGENAIASGLLDQIEPFHFVDWLRYGGPLVLILLPLTWLLLRWALPIRGVAIDIMPAGRELVRLGKLKGPEKEILVVLAASVLLWMTGAGLEHLLSLPTTLLSSAIVAIGAVAVLSIEEIVDWNDLKGVNWGIFFVIGAGMTLGDALEKSGVSAWFAELLAPLLGPLSYPVVLALVVLGAFALTQLINNVPLGAVLTPVMISLAQAGGIDPVRLVLPTIMALAPAYMLGSGSARMTLIAVTGAVDAKTMLRTGLIVGLPSALVILTFYYVCSLLGWF